MAKVMKRFDFPTSRRMRYPWDDWLDGQIWELERGKDFVVGLDQMRKNAYNAAWSRGLRARTSNNKGKLVVMAFRAKGSSEKGAA